MAKGDIFKQVFMKGPGKNFFDLDHTVTMSMNMGELCPSALIECLPGDKFNIETQAMVRFLPLVSPVMSDIYVSHHYFFVPNRIIWPEWEDWITGQLEAAPPTITFDHATYGVWKNALGTYLGLPITSDTDTFDVSAIPFAAYWRIIEEYYRDQNLNESHFIELQAGDCNNLTFPGGTGWMNFNVGPPFRRAWNHDYFTSALPFAQKGDEAMIPVLDPTQNLPVVNSGERVAWTGRTVSTGSSVPAGSFDSNSAGNLVRTEQAWFDTNGTLEADTSAGAEATINNLRRMFRLQEWLERNARGGTRYVEHVLSHFGINLGDYRAGRPVYIGGSKERVTISEVLSTATTDYTGSEGAEVNPTGQMAGHGFSVHGSGKSTFKCPEHGYIIGITNIQPISEYCQQGIPRHFTRTDKLDYAWPTFANIGEQAILNKEVYAKSVNPDGTFGYTPRYSEYKYLNNRLVGEMNDEFRYWTTARNFATEPVLDATFIRCNPDNNIFAIQDQSVHNIICKVRHKIGAVRALPKFGVPTI